MADERRDYKRRWEAEHREAYRERRNGLARQRRVDDPERYLDQGRRYREAHREVLRERAKRYRAADPERAAAARRKYRSSMREYQRTLYRRLRREALLAYGGRCACCGEASEAFLTIDHIHNDGAAHRKQGAESGIFIYRWLHKEGYPPGRFQVLCYNCNCAKQHDREGHRAAHPRAVLIDGGGGVAVGE